MIGHARAAPLREQPPVPLPVAPSAPAVNAARGWSESSAELIAGTDIVEFADSASAALILEYFSAAAAKAPQG